MDAGEFSMNPSLQNSDGMSKDGRLRVREIIIVEGKYDKNALSQAVDGIIIATGGFGIFKNPQLRGLIRRLCAERGVVILTDPDGAGLVIRNYIKGFLPPEKIKQAYIPQVRGKERRKAAAGAEGLLGVEGMTADTLRQALIRAGVSSAARPRDPVTKSDLYEWGLSGGRDSAKKRAALCAALELPPSISANALCQALTVLYDKGEIWEILQKATLY